MKNLYERLSTIKIEIPEINKRREDIVPICEYYLDFYNQNKKYKFSFSQNTKTKLKIVLIYPLKKLEIILKEIILYRKFNVLMVILVKYQILLVWSAQLSIENLSH